MNKTKIQSHSNGKTFTQYDDLEPMDLCRKLDRPPSHEFPYQHKFVKVVGDVEMAYLESGQLDSDNVVLFVHGAPEQAYVWRNIMPYLENYARVIAVEHVGHGLSDKLDIDYTIEDYVKYLFSFIETLELDNITVVCQDWGSGIGPYYGACNPDKVQGVVLMEALLAPSYPIRDAEIARNDPTMAIAMDHYDRWRSDDAEKWNSEQNLFVERILNMHTARQMTQRELDVYRDPFRDPNSRQPMLEWPRQVGYGGDRPYVDRAMDAINEWLFTSDVKVLDIFSKPGAVTTELDVAWRAERIEHHESAFVGMGNHFLQEDQPEQIGHAIGDWYRRHHAKSKKVWYKQPRNEMETILHFFDAVTKGDVDTALSMIHPDCHWVYRGPDSIPFAGEYRGPQGVGEYLQKFGSLVEIVEFEPELIWNDNDVIIQAHEINRLHGQERTIELEVTQVFKVKNGWILSFQEYADTALMASLFEA
jgi:haloalkane dehalogenase